MNLYAGTTGYSYQEWKGSFYPEKLPAKEMLAYYAARFQAVEISLPGAVLPHIGNIWIGSYMTKYR